MYRYNVCVCACVCARVCVCVCVCSMTSCAYLLAVQGQGHRVSYVGSSNGGHGLSKGGAAC